MAKSRKQQSNIENREIVTEVETQEVVPFPEILEDATVEEETVVDEVIEEEPVVAEEPSSIDEAFEASQTVSTGTGVRGLEGTAALSSVARGIVADVLEIINKDFNTYKDEFLASKASHNDMDKLLEKLVPFSEVNLAFLTVLPEATTNGMLKSQQSKRSRAKGKVMTMDNYKSMMMGAVSEKLIRLATGKVKTACGTRRSSGAIEFTEEQLAALTIDQDTLKKELRNVQSKKSIMKSKVGFTVESDRWKSLLVAEAQLKGIRVSNSVTKLVEVEVDTTKNNLEELLLGIDPAQLKAADSKQLLASIKSLLG